MIIEIGLRWSKNGYWHGKGNKIPAEAVSVHTELKPLGKVWSSHPCPKSYHQMS